MIRQWLDYTQPHQTDRGGHLGASQVDRGVGVGGGVNHWSPTFVLLNINPSKFFSPNLPKPITQKCEVRVATEMM